MTVLVHLCVYANLFLVCTNSQVIIAVCHGNNSRRLYSVGICTLCVFCQMYWYRHILGTLLSLKNRGVSQCFYGILNLLYYIKTHKSNYCVAVPLKLNGLVCVCQSYLSGSQVIWTWPTKTLTPRPPLRLPPTASSLTPRLCGKKLSAQNRLSLSARSLLLQVCDQLCIHRDHYRSWVQIKSKKGPCVTNLLKSEGVLN